MSQAAPLVLAAVLLTPAAAPAAGLTLGARVEFVHPGKGHELHVSPAAVAVGRDGRPLIAWVAQEGGANNVYVLRADAAGARPVRVNPDDLSADSLHQAPGLALGPDGEIYVSWSSRKPRTEGSLFASDLRVSRSLDGGVSFDRPLRVNEDRPIAHSFEGLAVAADGALLVAWIDGREGSDRPRTYLARVNDRGGTVSSVVRLDGEETCVCCRVDVAAGGDTVVALWRKVFPGSLRDMVLGLSRDGGRTFGPSLLVHPDRWKISACPHRGGSLGLDGRGRIYAAWYTEGTQETSRLLLAVSADGRRFAAPRRLDIAAGSIPDHLRLGVNDGGTAVAVWEDSTAVRRRVLLRYSVNGGQTFSAVRPLSMALKAHAPDIAVTPGGHFVVTWHEEQFPLLRTVVQSLRVDGRP